MPLPWSAGPIPDSDQELLTTLTNDGLPHSILPLMLSQMTEQSTVGGRLVHYSSVWKELIQDDWVLDMVSHGVTFDFLGDAPSQLSSPRDLTMSQEDFTACSNEVSEMSSKHAITALNSMPTDSFVNRIFPVKKKDGGTRPVIDCRDLNLAIPKVKFKMESLANVKHMLRRKDFMAKIDIKDAYFHLMIHPDFRKFLRFYWDGHPYEFRALPFGVTSAPRVFTKVMRPVIGLLRSRGIRCMIYLDDLLIMANTRDLCIQHLHDALTLLIKLGFKINWRKSMLIPSQVVQFLGLTIDSHAMMFRVPKDKVANVLESLTLLTRPFARWITQRQLAHVIGKLMALEAAVLPIRLRTRDLLRNLNTHKGDNWNQRIPIWQSARTEAQWWLSHLHEWNGRALVLPTPTVTITTDASESGWGAVFKNKHGQQETYGFWSLLQRSYGNNVRELLAGGFGLLSYSDLIKGESVLLEMDNTTAVAYVNHMGGRRDFLSLIAEDLWQWCIGQQTIVIARHLAGVLNTTADRLSRKVTDRTDWKLNPVLFEAIQQLWGPFTVDLFATALNTQLPRFVSWRAQPGAWRTDALSFSWAGLGIAWANPPFILIGRILTKVRREQATLAIVLPFWPTQAWWPLLLPLLADRPVVLPQRSDLYLPGNLGNEQHRDVPNWNSIVAFISGNKQRTAAFQHELASYLQTGSEHLPPNHTSITGDALQSGSTLNTFPTALLRQLEW